MATAILGKDVLIKIGSTPSSVVGQREGSFTLENDPIETSAKSDYPIRTYTGGWTRWSGSLTAVTDLTDTAGLLALEAAAAAGSPVSVTFYHSTRQYKGMAFVTSFERNAPYDNIDSASVRIQGTGTLTIGVP